MSHQEVAECVLAVVAIDFHQTRAFELETDDSGRPVKVVAEDPMGYFHKLHTKAGTPEGFFLADSDEYWKAIARALHKASSILLLGHGTGKSNASHHFIAYVEKHESDLAAKIVGDVRCDIDDLTNAQVLRLGQQFFDMAPARDNGDKYRSE
jgi:hypothetical protein